MDNGHGKGYLGQPGIFAVSMTCPLHSPKLPPPAHDLADANPPTP
jgi:hypothetical protein